MKKTIIILFIITLWSGIAISHDEEKYTGGGGYKITATNKYFVNIKDKKLYLLTVKATIFLVDFYLIKKI